MKRRSFLENALKKFGFTDQEVKDFIEKLDDDYDDNDAAKALARLMTADEAKGNDDIFKEIKGRTKAEALDPIDKLLKQYEPKLTEAQKTEYAKFGQNESHKKYQFMLKTFDEAGTKTGDKNYDDLKAEFDTLKGQLATDYVQKSVHETVVGNLSARDKEILDVKILNAAIKSGKLRDMSADRHFDRNFITDVHDLLNTGLGDKKQKGIIGADGKIMRADSPEQPLLIDNKPVGIADLATMAITAYGYEKKSDTTPQGQVQIQTEQPKARSLAAQAMIDEEKGKQ